MMNSSTLVRPSGNEYQEYFNRYISLVPEGNILSLMKDQLHTTLKFFERITEEKSMHRYDEGKWSIKEILGHIIDTELIMACRALRIARDDKKKLPGFDENEFVQNADFDRLSFTSLIELFIQNRKFTLALFNSLDGEEWTRIGDADGKLLSARSVPYILTGHLIHHLNVIEERYL